MTVVYPFFPGDQDLALKNASWIRELGGCKGHDIVLIHDARCNPQTVRHIKEFMSESFDRVHFHEVKTQVDGWPQGANMFFRVAANILESKPNTPYFFWLEPDAIPLREGWLDAIEANHKRSGMPFTGDRVEVENIPLHMSGVGIYPNPLHRYAGDACRSFDTAWDMQAKDQIVPKANFTSLIEHAWKHPAFATQEDVKSQIAVETLLFHSSKDGSLIDRLMENRGRNATPKALKEPEMPQPSSGSPSPSPSPACDIFIRTYPGDYEWLYFCLCSIQKFCGDGFHKLTVCSPQGPPQYWLDWKDRYRNADSWYWKVVNDETEDGYLAQQCTKLYADVITDYQADAILHVDSDVIFNTPFRSQDFFSAGGKPFWYYTPYKDIETPWQPVIEKFMQEKVENEFMRRFPIMVPRWLYPRLREFAYRVQKRTVTDYIKMQPAHEFSEFNALGAYAYKYHHDQIEWINTLEVNLAPPCAKQYHSWGGITSEIKAEIEGFFASVNSNGPGVLAADPLPAISPEEKSGASDGDVRRCASPPPVNLSNLEQYVRNLADFAAQDIQNKAKVMRWLVATGLKDKKPQKKKHVKKNHLKAVSSP